MTHLPHLCVETTDGFNNKNNFISIVLSNITATKIFPDNKLTMNLQTDIQYLYDCRYTRITAQVYNFIQF